MKRLIAILCLSIFLFNLYGYQLLINHWQKGEELALQDQIHTNNLQEEDLISIKVPAALPPYSSNLETFEWVDGEVNVDGTIYRYVKRRIFKDSVEFLCVPHTAKMRLENARENFFRLCNDLQNASQQEQQQGSLQLKPIIFVFCSDVADYYIPLIEDNSKTCLSIYNEQEAVANVFTIDHPPESFLS